MGDYFYQESRKEAVDCLQLQERMTRFLQMLKQNRPQHAEPETIVVVRDGISEGQFRMVSMPVKDKLMQCSNLGRR